MQALDVVHVVQERAEIDPRFLKVFVVAEVHLLFLERLEETLRFGVIIRAARFARVLLGACSGLVEPAKGRRNALCRRHKRLSVCMMLRTRLWLTVQASR